MILGQYTFHWLIKYILSTHVVVHYKKGWWNIPLWRIPVLIFPFSIVYMLWEGWCKWQVSTITSGILVTELQIRALWVSSTKQTKNKESTWCLHPGFKISIWSRWNDPKPKEANYIWYDLIEDIFWQHNLALQDFSKGLRTEGWIEKIRRDVTSTDHN